MKFGIGTFSTDYSIRPDELAKACEERGFESLWFGEHTHIPTSRRSIGPGGQDIVTKDYWHSHDLFVSLMAAAAATKTLKVASGICLAVEHDPIKLAKEVASLDQLSNGRVLFGIGGGWNAEEMENHGTPFKHRWQVLREKVEAMKEIWTKDEAAYYGEFVNFDPIWCYPKPLQKPHPPILLGTYGKGLHRVVRYADGWLTVSFLLPDLAAAIKELHAKAEEAGRKPSEVPVSIIGIPDKAELDRYQALGVDRVIPFVPAEGRDTVLPALDNYAALMSQFK